MSPFQLAVLFRIGDVWLDDNLLHSAAILNAALFGGLVSLFIVRIPPSGKAALVISILPLIFLFLEFVPFPNHRVKLIPRAFLAFTLPCCLLYAIHARKRGTDKLYALAAVTGSCVLALPYIIFLIAAAMMFLEEVTSLLEG